MVFQLDSDEYATRALISDIRRVCETDVPPAAEYVTASFYEYRGRVIDCATTYPMRRPRLFLAAAATGYKGLTNERVVVEGPPETLESGFIIPLPPTLLLLRKWARYLKIAAEGAREQSEAELWADLRHRKSQIRWFIRDLWRKRIQATCENPLPFRFEAFRGVFYALQFGVSISEVGRRRIWKNTQPPG